MAMDLRTYSALSPDGGTSVFINDGHGNFTSGQALTGRGVLLGDIDGNGTLDAITTAPTGSPDIEFWSNDGTGHFTFDRTIATGVAAGGVADFSGDGIADIYGVDQSGSILTFINDGHGNFSQGGSLDPGSHFGTTPGLLFSS